MVSANNHGKNPGAGSMQISGNRRVGLKQGLSVLLLVPLFVFALDREPESRQGVSGGDINCVASLAWVESPSEANAAGFRPNSNCSFHQWAYQNFLWLTSEAGTTGETIFEGFANPTALFVPGGPTRPYPGRATGTAIDMLARFGKSQTTADIEDIFQAGPGNKILVDQHGEVVFYSNHLNETFWNFIVDNALYELPNLQAIPPGTNFPVGALELKAAWRVAEKGGRVLIPNADRRFYVVETSIPTVTVNSQGQVVEDKTRMIRAKMAFIGMHVTGTVRGHPEFIWATFEHVDNAPLCNSVDSLPAATGPGPTGPWSLYAPGTPTRWANQFDVNDPLAVVNVCLVHAQGGGNPDNRNAVTTLNENVHALPMSAPWPNYLLGGGVWTNGDVPLNNGAFAPDKPNARQLGSLDLANTTMETFTQNDNCFACHNGGSHVIVVGGGATDVNAKNINLSHYVVNYQAVQQVRGRQ